MKREALFICLFFAIVIIALVLSAANQAQTDGEGASLTPWQPLQITPEPSQPIQAPGWWDELTSPVPFPSQTPRR